MKNKVIGGLIIATGVFFTLAAILPDYESIKSFALASKLYQLGGITGFSACMTKILIKENNNG